jgi:hypothetical protein
VKSLENTIANRRAAPVKAPFPCSCGGAYVVVIDSRWSRAEDSTRRRRVCWQCSDRITTYERACDAPREEGWGLDAAD